MTAYDQDWRQGAKKIMFLIADTSPHDPEPVTGFTGEQVIQKSREIDPVQIYPIWFNGFVRTEHQAEYEQYAGQLSSLTGGRIIKTPNSLNGNISLGFTNSVLNISSDPTAYIDGPEEGNVGEELAFSGMKSYDPDSSIANYAWDFDNDQQTDYQSASPITTHSFPAAYSGPVTLIITSNDGGTSSSTHTINIGNLTAPTQSPLVISGGLGSSSAEVTDTVASTHIETPLSAGEPQVLAATTEPLAEKPLIEKIKTGFMSNDSKLTSLFPDAVKPSRPLILNPKIKFAAILGLGGSLMWYGSAKVVELNDD
jgi:hypothetical protein